MVKNGCGQPGHGTLKLTASHEWADFLHAARNSGKLKVILMIFERSWSISLWVPKTSCILRLSAWIELIFPCQLWCNNFRVEQHHTLYLWLLKAVVIVDSPAVVGRAVLWNRVCLSCLSHCFLGIGWLDFSEFWQGARNHYQVVYGRVGFFGKTFCP